MSINIRQWKVGDRARFTGEQWPCHDKLGTVVEVRPGDNWAYVQPDGERTKHLVYDLNNSANDRVEFWAVELVEPELVELGEWDTLTRGQKVFLVQGEVKLEMIVKYPYGADNVELSFAEGDDSLLDLYKSDPSAPKIFVEAETVRKAPEPGLYTVGTRCVLYIPEGDRPARFTAATGDWINLDDVGDYFGDDGQPRDDVKKVTL